MPEDQTLQDSGFIDVDAIFKKKNPHLYKLMPGFLLEYIKRTIHQDKLNEALVKFRNNYGLDFIHQILVYLGIDYSVKGEENIPDQGRFIFVANHPLGGLDGMILIELAGKHFKEVKTISNDLLMNLKNLEEIFIPVNNFGRQSTEYVKGVQELYRSDAQVILFPAGICSRKKGKLIRDLEWKKSFVTKAIEYKRNIIPVHFNGKNSCFFYRLANLRKMLGIRANLEMFYLPDEMLRQSKQKIHVTVGKPISWSDLDKSKSHAEWAEELKKTVYKLGDN